MSKKLKQKILNTNFKTGYVASIKHKIVLGLKVTQRELETASRYIDSIDEREKAYIDKAELFRKLIDDDF